MFQEFHTAADTKSDDDYATKLRLFSTTLNEAVRESFREALRRLRKRRGGPDELPVMPIVLGGDDLTVVIEGKHAVRFAADFLAAFEQEAAGNRLIADIMAKAPGAAGRVTARAGVAVVKPHFPFSAAYDLAEELTASAKTYLNTLKAPASALDFHILYDASGPDLDRIRTASKASDGTPLTARPYRVTDDSSDRRGTAALTAAVGAVTATEDGRRVLPNSTLHHLREALTHGVIAANHEFQLVRHRYHGFTKLFRDGCEGMYFTDDTGTATHLLDALDLAGFWPEDRP